VRARLSDPATSAPVADASRSGPPGTARVLIEVPHGATERADFDAVAAQLRSPLPDGLAAFFHVNTDEGAPELADAIARRLAGAGVPTLVLRCRIPRTFVDANRQIEGEITAGMTAGIPAYVTDAADRALLLELHARYQERARAAYAEVCGAGGLALALHTYAPRSVEVAVDADVVPALRAAYRPRAYRAWPLRPEVDLITRTPDGRTFAPEGIAGRLRAALGPLGIEVGENATYALHPATTAFEHSRRWPGRVLCLEVRRDLLGAPWVPFDPSPIGPRKTARFARALAAALAPLSESI
jgi:hypothetical protein